MNKIADESVFARPAAWQGAVLQRRLRQRYRNERAFRTLGLLALTTAAGFLLFLLSTLAMEGLSGLRTTDVRLHARFDPATLDLTATALAGPAAADALQRADYRNAAFQSLYAMFPQVQSLADRRRLSGLLSEAAGLELRAALTADPRLLGQSRDLWVPASSLVDLIAKDKIDRATPSGSGPDTEDPLIAWVQDLERQDALRTRFNSRFFSGGDSRDPELAAIWGAAKGSLLVALVTLLLSFPMGVLSALYLEEFAPKNRWTDLIEVNINNLAAVPSIIFGLLGLSIFLNFFGLPRSSALVGGMTLALMTLPTIVITARAAIKAVPPSISHAAIGLGASPLQTAFHHVLPLALPGIMTGVILSVARAIGETAPLLMVGMRAFIIDVPSSFTQDAATVLPVQIYLWSDSVERGFIEKTSAAILVLLAILMILNAAAVFLRQKFERSW